jgi:hypothetical protein
MDAIREAHEPLWRHLDASIETGAFLRYRPPPGPAGRRA